MMVDIRELAPGDLDDVAAIEEATNPQPWTRRMFVEELSLPPSGRFWLVAVQERSVLGFAGMMFTPDAAHLMLVAVDLAATRQRLASRLCLALFDETRRRGVAGVTLEVRVSNTAAVGLYERLGMVVKGTRPRYYPDGEDALLFWIDDLSDPAIEALHDPLRADPETRAAT